MVLSMWFTVAQGLDALKNHGGFLALFVAKTQQIWWISGDFKVENARIRVDSRVAGTVEGSGRDRL
jgi:hypothetical protein